MKCSVFIATSLDGYIARQDGAIDWLMKVNELAPKGEDCGYKAFISSVDVLVMGRHSYEAVCQFDPWPYGDLKVIVMSRTGVDIPNSMKHIISQTNESPLALYARLSQAGFKHAYIDGGAIIQSFINDDLIDELTITTAPVLIGQGIPLFGELKNDLSLKLLNSKGYDFGFTQSKYEIEK